MMMNAENTFSWSPDGKVCAVIGAANDVRLYDASSGTNVATIQSHEGNAVALAFSANSNQLVTTGIDRTIKIWDVTNAGQGRTQLVRTFGGSALPITSVTFSSDGRTISTSASSAVNVWDLSSGSSSRTLALTPREVRGALDAIQEEHGSQLSAGGQYVSTRTSDGGVKVLETRTGKEVRTLSNEPGTKLGYSELSQDGKLLVVPEGTDRSLTGASGQPLASPAAGAAASTQAPTQTSPQQNPQQARHRAIPKNRQKKRASRWRKCSNPARWAEAAAVEWGA